MTGKVMTGECNVTTGSAAATTEPPVGDTPSFAELYGRHATQVYNVVFNATRDRDEAEDLTQTVFATAYEHRGDLRDASRAKAWLLISAANLARRHLRDRRPTEAMDQLVDRPAHGPLLEDAVLAQQSADLVWEAAGSLETHHRIALDLRLRHGLTAAEIADALGMTRRQASDVGHRASEALRTGVRALLVRRRASECPGLATLLLDAGHDFTVEQRRSVDRHMRRCPNCRALADRLTKPAELFGGLILLPLPASLVHPNTEWLHGPTSAMSGAGVTPTIAHGATSIAPRGRGLQHRLTGPTAIAAIAGIAALGTAGGVYGHLHGGTTGPTTVQPGQGAQASGAAAGNTVTPTSTAEPAQDASAIWNDTLTDVRRSSSYHLTFAASPTSSSTSDFDMRFDGSGYAGLLTVNGLSNHQYELSAVHGVVYVHGPSVQQTPYLFGLTTNQAASLGSAWLRLTDTGSQHFFIHIVQTAMTPFSTPDRLATGILSPSGTPHRQGDITYQGQSAIVLADDTGSMYVTNSPMPLPLHVSADLGDLTLDGFNAQPAIEPPASVAEIQGT